jgi:hypothetical protein
MQLGNVGGFLGNGAWVLIAAGGFALAGCGAAEGFGGGELEGAPEEVGRIEEAIEGGWTSLSLKNGWKAATGGHTPAVGIVNGVVTFRGALDGSSATNNTAFCLTSPTFTNFRPADVGYVAMRSAMASGNAVGTLVMGIGDPRPGFDGYCVQVNEQGATSQPGPNARLMTSLDGASYERSVADSKFLARASDWSSSSPYPMRGTDSTAHPQGQGVYAKLVDGFVRFQGNLAAGEGASSTILTLPSGQGMKPGHNVYVPVTFCPLGAGAVQGRIQIRPSGAVIYEGDNAKAWCGISLDGASYSMANYAGSNPIKLSNGWVSSDGFGVRARSLRGVVRLEGAVKDGTSTTIGTLPEGTRPSTAVYVVANGLLYAQSATLRISSSGVIKVITPVLVAAQPGISLDGVSFGL